MATADAYAFASELIDDRQAFQCAAVNRLVVNKVVAPDVMPMLGTMYPVGAAA
jgi:hypothetical protein